ncbi:Holliday junction resolvase RecU [Alicyclobacillus contaminans]|uniref:Holliday junction resolvase RecU n=1 Tax=Alicyclobacillus contaminans TaxID=392016 RepID=UPI00054E57B2|nr:Holliday junction resolvase RecU [Alicyclobacillus contaminans]GMA49344.1 Holliday junction resolvase RecU [Alicyclobacillus contaminans]
MISQANRGMAFEELVEYANRQYHARGVAVIQKVPTPVKMIRRGAQIVSAFPERKSTVDFIGVAGGRAIAFDAKSTRIDTRFPLDNIEQHQFEFLLDWQSQGGISFMLIEFVNLREVRLLPFDVLNLHWTAMQKGGRKSIPIEEIRQSCARVKPGRGVILDYLGAVVQ